MQFIPRYLLPAIMDTYWQRFLGMVSLFPFLLCREQWRQSWCRKAEDLSKDLLSEKDVRIIWLMCRGPVYDEQLSRYGRC